MFGEALLAAVLVGLVSLCGAFIFGSKRGLVGIERYVIPVAVGVFLSLVLFELVPETLAASADWGGVAVAVGFIGFYILAQYLHQYFHRVGSDDCDRKSAAALLLIGDAIHNVADGIILAGAFMLDPTVGVATAIGLAAHELPQEIVEFGVFIRAGYSRMQAAWRNLLSAGGIVIGVLLTYSVAAYGEEYLWIFTGVAAGNLLFLAASDLLPRIHGNLERYGSIWYATGAIVLGFVLMTVVIEWSHEYTVHTHEHGHHIEDVSHQHEVDLDDHDHHHDDEANHQH